MKSITKCAAGAVLSIFVFASDAGAEDVEQVFGDWTYRSRLDALDGNTTHQAFVFDKSEPIGVLGIQCDKAGDPTLGRLYIKYIQAGAFFGTKGLYPVKFRVDENPLVEQEWVVREQTIYTPNDLNVATMVPQLKAGGSIIIEAYDYRFRSHRNTFSLTGAGEAISTVERGAGDRF